MLILYPQDSFNAHSVDECYLEEWQAAKNAGLQTALFDFDLFQTGESPSIPDAAPNQKVLYRGWMMAEGNYRRLYQLVQSQGGQLATSPASYVLCHHLPGWYPQLSDYTAETLFFDEQADVETAVREHGWTGCFLKDHVKSLSTGQGSLLRELDQISACIHQMLKYRGFIEGGLCARKIEVYKPESEFRFFVINGRPYGDGADIPECVQAAAKVIKSPFFSIDVALREDGVQRIIELGDGQVSDRKHWQAEKLVSAMRNSFNL